MIENEDGRVSGSIDRARVAELLAATGDDELKTYYRDLLGESADGKAVDQPAEAEPEPVGAEQQQPSMAMSKPELVELAQGKVDDPESKTKAELVEALGGDV